MPLDRHLARVCDTYDCDALATHRVDWREAGGYYCDECAERLRNACDNVWPLPGGANA